ncbi:MAG: M48 family metallopeptidase [Dehalococcoidia bacterium]
MSYELQRTPRRKTVGIAVEPDRRVVVLAPGHVDGARIDAIVARRLGWIRRQHRRLDALASPPLPRQWVAGETHRYLGRQYRLKIVSGRQREVKLSGAFFVVTLPRPGDRQAVQRLMESWYREHARAVIEARLAKLLTATTWLDVEPPPFTLRALRQRWGSTTAAGRVAFNIDLIKLPAGCIDYVIAHELVHLRIHNHSPAFWRMLGRVMPDWQQWRERLGRVEV